MKIFLTVILLLTGYFSIAQDEDLADRSLLDFVAGTETYFEGFTESTGSNDFSYHSFRSGINDCLLSRSTDGNMTIEWETSIPHKIEEGDDVGFLWMAAMDVNPENYRFDLYVNGIHRFTIQTGKEPDWEIRENGAMLQFHAMEVDHNGDALGYMAMQVPATWLISGQRQQIRITGEPAGSNAWIIVYKATDAAEFLRNSVLYNTWMKMTVHKQSGHHEASIEAPVLIAGETLSWSSGRQHGTFSLERKDNRARGQISLPGNMTEKPLAIEDSIGAMILLDSFGKTGSLTKLQSKAILDMNLKKDENGNLIIESRRIYNPDAVKSLVALSGSEISKGTIYLMNSSHQDIAWMDSPEKCVLERDTMLLTPLFEMASEDPQYRFDVEDALMLKEYVERHPEKKELVRIMLSDGRISCGSTFIQPYEEMYSGEALARQFYFGAKWLKDEFGYRSRVYWNMDVPGRTLQMPQLMKKSGTDYLMMSRFRKGFYRWYSPDGSSVIAFSPGHYADAFTALQKDFHEAAQYIAASSVDWVKYCPDNASNAVIPLLSDWDMSPAVDYTPLISQWKMITEIRNEKDESVTVSLPRFIVSSADEFFGAVPGDINNLTSIRGERPAIWLYIHGPSHQKALKASREGDILLTQAEKFSTANAWIDGSFKDYPETELRKAWESKIYPDHGWGGKNGDITDHYFLEKFLYARSEGERLLNRALNEISEKINTDPRKGKPLIVFNSLSWDRTDVVNARLQFDPGETKEVVLKDAGGHDIPAQITNREIYPDGFLKRVDICFVGSNIPSMGYKTYYYSSATSDETTPSESLPEFENKFYKIEFGRGGLKRIYDKELEKELIDASKFRAGEIFTMRSAGNGAGEFANVQQPDMKGFDQTGNYETVWTLNRQGPVFSSYSMRQPFRNATVEEEVIIYHEIKRIDFQVKLLNWEGVLYREFRFAMPLNMANGKVVYEVPYGILEVGKDEMEGNAGERYIYPCRETRPRGIQNFIGAYDQDVSVILSSTVAVADYSDPTDNPLPGPVLQPLLLASRKSCHWEGNDYLQTGNHSFRFSLTSTRSDWRNGYKQGIQANEELVAVTAWHRYNDAGLPEEMSFFNPGQTNVMVTTLKKAEDEPCAVVRFVEMEGKDSQTVIESYLDNPTLFHASLTEEATGERETSAKVAFPIGHHGIETFKLK